MLCVMKYTTIGMGLRKSERQLKRQSASLRPGFDPGWWRRGDFSLLLRVQTGPEVLSASCEISTGAFLGYRRPSVGPTTLPLPSAETANMWILVSTSLWAFMVCNGDTFTFNSYLNTGITMGVFTTYLHIRLRSLLVSGVYNRALCSRFLAEIMPIRESQNSELFVFFKRFFSMEINVNFANPSSFCVLIKTISFYSFHCYETSFDRITASKNCQN